MDQATPPSGNNKIIIYIAIVVGAIITVSMLINFSKFADSKKKKSSESSQFISQPNSSTTEGNQSNETDDQSQVYEKLLVQTANEVNKSCPFMVDKETRLDNAVTMNGNEFQYNYTLINSTKGSVDIPTLENYMRPNLINLIKTNPDLKIFRDNKTTVSYNYSDRNGVFLLKISVTPDQYQ